MRHRVKKNKLSRSVSHRTALSKNQASQLIEHEKIETTLAKAKSLRPYVENLITRAIKAKDQDKTKVFNTVQYLKSRLHTDESVKKLLEDLGPRFANRKGGYTRITRTRHRDGDNSVVARIELVEKAKKEKTTDKGQNKVKKISGGKKEKTTENES